MGLLEALLYLSLNIYHEARGEGVVGQKAVAHVTLNRAIERDMSIKDVVLEPKQFSWTFEKTTYLPDDLDSFFNCVAVATHAANEDDFTGGSTHYHALSVQPYWASSLEEIGNIGNHKFYR